MDDLPAKKTDWSETENALEPSVGHPASPSNPSLDAPYEAPAHPLLKRFGNPKGVLMEFQAGKVKRGAAIEAMKVWHHGQLEVVKVQVEKAVEVHTAKATVDAGRFLARLDNEYLEYLGELGLRNVSTRQEMLGRLVGQTSEILKQIQEQDAPPALRASAIRRVMDMHEDFADKLQKDLAELDKSG